MGIHFFFPLLKVKAEVKLSLCFNWPPHHVGALRKWRYSSTNSWPQHYMEVSGQFHGPAALPPEKGPVVPIG